MDTRPYVETDVAARLDRLPWSKWHWLIVTALGITWILDGLEATLGSALGGVLKDPNISLGLSDAQIGLGATLYLLYLFPFAFGNLLGPVLMGHLFDSIGRKTMIAITYGLSGLLLAVTGYLFSTGVLTALTQTTAWSVIFFVASAAASSAYLTLSEIFPLEIRGLAIAIFYACGTLAGSFAPSIFGAIVGTGSRQTLFFAYCFGGGLMVVAAVVAAFLGVKAERQSLESVAAPLSSSPAG